MQKILDALGGRKFLLTLVVLALAALIELKTERGISEQFVALLIGVLGVFNAANAVITTKAMTNEAKVASEAKDVNGPVNSVDPVVHQALAKVLDVQQEQSEVMQQVAKAVTNANTLLAASITKR